MTEENNLNAIEKSIMVLNAFGPRNEELGTRELSRILGFSSSTVSRILQVFLKHNMVQKNPNNNKYQLGTGIMMLGNSVNPTVEKNNILSIAEPHLLELNRTTQENVALVVLSKDRIIIMRELESSLRIKPEQNPIGIEPNWHASASVRAILSFSEEKLRQKFFKRKREKYTPQTITDLNILKKQLIKIRKTGVSFDFGEKFEDVWAVASPIFNQKKEPIGAIGTYGPSFRIKERLETELAELTRKSAQQISNSVFF